MLEKTRNSDETFFPSFFANHCIYMERERERERVVENSTGYLNL